MPTTDEIAARIRAARNHAGKKVPELAKHMGYSVRTWNRVESGEKALKDAEEMGKVARFCQVPLVFLQQGFEAAADDSSERMVRVEDLALQHIGFVRERAAAHDRRMAEINNRLAGIEECVTSNQRLLEGLQGAVVSLAADSLRQTQALEELAGEDRLEERPASGQ